LRLQRLPHHSPSFTDQGLSLPLLPRYFRTGLYSAPLPFITGKEAAGTVISVHPSVSSSDSPVKEGDRVAYIGDRTYAEYTAIPAANVAPIPDGVSTSLAAASLLQGLTALTFVHEAVGLSPLKPLGVGSGPWVLVHAAAGGTGSWLVQLLTLAGAKVIGTAGGPEKVGIAKKNGAQWVIDSRAEDVVARVKEITGGKGVDVIFDGVGKATFEADLDMIARKGTLIMFGNAVCFAFPCSLV